MLLQEPEEEPIAHAIVDSGGCRISSGNYLETSIVALGRAGSDGLRDLDLLLARFRIAVAPFTEPQALLARQAFVRFGKGRHPAGLNFGDCMAYALAREAGEELLFKGTDFGLTDVAVAAY